MNNNNNLLIHHTSYNVNVFVYGLLYVLRRNIGKSYGIIVMSAEKTCILVNLKNMLILI